MKCPKSQLFQHTSTLTQLKTNVSKIKIILKKVKHYIPKIRSSPKFMNAPINVPRNALLI